MNAKFAVLSHFARLAMVHYVDAGHVRFADVMLNPVARNVSTIYWRKGSGPLWLEEGFVEEFRDVVRRLGPEYAMSEAAVEYYCDVQPLTGGPTWEEAKAAFEELDAEATAVLTDAE
jgi:hypothetical protein